MNEIEWAELRINDGDGGDYLNIYSDDKTYSYLLEDVFERMNETDLARITAERDALFQIAVKATRCIDEMGFITLKGKAKELDHALATLEPELWERVDAAALKSS